MSVLLAAAAAIRVLSADFCADQFVLALADREDIAALSPDAARDFSFLRDKAAGLPKARADAEQIAARGADLVLRFWGGDAARFERLGVRTVTLGYAADFEAVKSNVRAAAAALGREPRGERVIADMEARLSALAERGGDRPRALYVTPGGVTAAKGTMIDSILTAAGVVNVSAEQNLSGWPALPLEALVADPLEVIVTGFFKSDGEAADHWSASRHPAFGKAFEGARVIHLPADLISCPAFFSVDAAEFIHTEIDQVAR